jgi:plastocyanin
MARRPLRLPLLIAALLAGVAAAVMLPAMAPGDAPPTTASFTAQDFAWNATGGTTHSVTVAVGGTVDFGYPSGTSSHNADFAGGPAPSSCTQTAGVDSGPVPPLPAFPTARGWSGSCRFDAAGTYSFHCDLHAFMTGTVVVVDPNAPPPTTTTTPPTTTRTPPPTTTTAPGGTTTTPGGGGSGSAGEGGSAGGGSGSTGGGGAASGRVRVRFVHRQHGAVVRGSVTTPAAHWRVVVTALASNRALARHRPRHIRDVRIASQRSRSDASARTSFALRVSALARAALHRRGRLAVELRIAATPPGGGGATKATVAVVLRD